MSFACLLCWVRIGDSEGHSAALGVLSKRVELSVITFVFSNVGSREIDTSDV